MGSAGAVVPLNAPIPGRPNASCHLICDFLSKRVSLAVVDPSARPNMRLQIWEVQEYNRVAG